MGLFDRRKEWEGVIGRLRGRSKNGSWRSIFAQEIDVGMRGGGVCWGGEGEGREKGVSGAGGVWMRFKERRGWEGM